MIENKKVRGILTSCIHPNESNEVDVEYEITVSSDKRRVFQLVNGVTGHEDFYIDKSDGVLSEAIERLSKNGWLACIGTAGKWNRLFIPANEMKKALEDVIK